MLDHTPIFPSAALFGDHPEPLYLSIYAGLAVAVFALAGLFARTRGAALFAFLALLSVVLALGGHTPLFRLLHEAGVLRFVRFPEKFLTMGTFVTIVFAASVLERLLAGDARVRRAALLVAASVSLFAGAAAVMAWLPVYESLLRSLYRIDATANIFYLVPLSQKAWALVAIRGALLFLLIRNAGRNAWHAHRAVWATLFIAFVLTDLIGQVPEIAPRLPRSYLTEIPATVRQLPANRDDFRIFHFAGWVQLTRQRPVLGPPDDNFLWAMRNELPLQLASAYGLRTVIDGDLDFSDLQSERDFVAAALELMKKEGRPADWMDILAAMSNAWFVSVYRRPEEIRSLGGDAQQQAMRFLELPHYPRYYFASELATIREPWDFVRALRSRRYSRQVAFVQQPAFVPAPGKVHAWRETANHTRLEVEARGPAFLVMSVTPHKNWRITIDGREASAVVANLGYQGVVVPQGRHVVEMRYRDPLVMVGGAVSAATLLALLLLRRRDGGS